MTFALAPHVTATETAHGMVLLDARRGTYWQLNATGAAVLLALTSGTDPASAAAGLTAAHPEAAATAAADVTAFLTTLREAGLVTGGAA
ncbi:lasso peptide biosynthesis PqqD family chaperone [Spirillospora sp. NPDC029432]|uniref:lasso peptide biosynthesis PqqD family chaperone n=1 Tax=Spirillospora sp. NPDC029432 TaxID=3154599 RepID=UPI003451525D